MKEKTIPNFKDEVTKYFGNADEFKKWIQESIDLVHKAGLKTTKESYSICDNLDTWCDPSVKGMRKSHNILGFTFPENNNGDLRKTNSGIFLPDCAPDERKDVKIAILAVDEYDSTGIIPVLIKAYGNQELGNNCHLIPTQNILLEYDKTLIGL